MLFSAEKNLCSTVRKKQAVYLRLLESYLIVPYKNLKHLTLVKQTFFIHRQSRHFENK